MNKKVIIGMSGGVDSSVAAYLLKEQGYEPIGITLKHLGDGDSESNTKTCCSLDDIYDARSACFKVGIPHYVINCVDEFEKEVIEYFVDEYSRGNTPSPCIICNEKIKIKNLVEVADKMGARYISTGHYCSVVNDSEYGSPLIKMSADLKKDQTYMLYRIEKEWIDRLVFPLENYEKPEVRKMAEEVGFHIHDKKDSQGICFAPNGYKEYLQNNLETEKGNFVDKEGNIMGTHDGYQLYTIGQRRGLNLKLPRAYFVIEILPKTNEVVLGDFDDLFSDEIEIRDEKFFVDIEVLLKKELIARPRFSSHGLRGHLEKRGDSLFFVYLNRNAENARGQHVVFYSDTYLLGGGIIK